MISRFFFTTSCVLVLSSFLPQEGMTQDFPEHSPEYVRGRVEHILDEREESTGGLTRTIQEAELELISGPEEGKRITVENGVLGDREDMKLQKGETVILEKLVLMDGETLYAIREKYRLPSILMLGAIFLLLGMMLGGKKGASAILGLIFSIGVLTFFVVPRIAHGGDPFTISLIGACAIATGSLYLAHGFSKQTSVALLSTFLTLGCSVLMAMLFVSSAKLFGMGSEESMFLQIGPLQSVNLRGLLLGGIVIGALGVLDDITTTQTAVIAEIRKANPRLTARELYAAGTSIGREHIASLINTLALAYVGASLPFLLLFSTDQSAPLWTILNSEFVAEEIVRTLVGSTTLLLAVPISTWLAAYAFQNMRMADSTPSHLHPFHSH